MSFRVGGGRDDTASPRPESETADSRGQGRRRRASRERGADGDGDGDAMDLEGDEDGHPRGGRRGRYEDDEEDRGRARNADDEEDDEDPDVVVEDDGFADMQAMMGFGGFGTTKDKKVAGNNAGAVRKEKTTQYRQYMNRTKGFNRPLSPPR